MVYVLIKVKSVFSTDKTYLEYYLKEHIIGTF